MSTATETPAQGPRRRSKEVDVEFGKAFDLFLIRRLMPFIKPYRRLFLVGLLSYPVVSLLHLVQPYLVKVAIDDHLLTKELEGFGTLVVLFIVSVVFEFLARFGQAVLTQILGQRITRDLRVALFQKLQSVDLAYIEKNPVGRLITRVTNDVEALSELFSAGAISIIGDFVTLIGIIVMMLILDWRLTLFAFTALPPLILIIAIMRKYAREAFRNIRIHIARINAFLNEAISGMSLVQSFRQERAMMAEFKEINGAYRNANFSAIRYDAMTYAIVEAIATAATALLLFLGLSLFETGLVEIGVFVAFVDYLRRFFTPITELSTKYTLLQSAMASAERSVELLDETPSVTDEAATQTLGPFQETIRFEHLSFRYHPEGPDVLTDLDLTIKRGEKIAIVGPTGSGKSTVVKLLARFYDPSAGCIRIDGVDLRHIPLQNLRERLAIVLQDPYLFDATIRENIAFGSPDVEADVLEEAAERTRAIEVIRQQEDGWDTMVGERGSRLSSGQRQVVAFARALAMDPEILILDEATSSVDPETEALIQKGLEALIRDRTSIIIAHRLSTIRHVDRIFVLVGGQVVEEGSHDMLIQQEGVYRKLYELQFADTLAA